MPTLMKESYGMLEKKRQGLLKKISKVGPFIMATPTYVKVKCGNLKCKCAKRKEDRHEKLHLSWTDAKGNGSCYVPIDLREEVLKWVENYWEMKEYMTEMTEISRKMIRMYSKTVGRGKKSLKKRA